MAAGVQHHPTAQRTRLSSARASSRHTSASRLAKYELRSLLTIGTAAGGRSEGLRGEESLSALCRRVFRRISRTTRSADFAWRMGTSSPGCKVSRIADPYLVHTYLTPHSLGKKVLRDAFDKACPYVAFSPQQLDDLGLRSRSSFFVRHPLHQRRKVDPFKARPPLASVERKLELRGEGNVDQDPADAPGALGRREAIPVFGNVLCHLKRVLAHRANCPSALWRRSGSLTNLLLLKAGRPASSGHLRLPPHAPSPRRGPRPAPPCPSGPPGPSVRTTCGSFAGCRRGSGKRLAPASA